eukprot:g3041.t1
MSYKRPSTVRSFGVRSDTSSAQVSRQHGNDLKSRIRDKVAESTKISSVFRKFDTNKNGKIDHDEFARGIGQLGFDVDKRGLQSLLRWVDPEDRGEIEYGTFARLMSHVDGPGGATHDPGKVRHYAAALRDNFGDSMHVAEGANAIEVGQVGVGEGAMAGENRYQRDVGDRATAGDLRNFDDEHEKGPELRMLPNVRRIGRSDGRDHVHQHTDRGLSYFEKSLRTPRYPRMNKEHAAMRTFAPGMARAIGKDNWYGEVAPQLLGLDEYGQEALPEPLSHRSTASFLAEASYTGGVKKVNSRSRLFAQRRGDNYRQNAALSFKAPFGDGVSAKRVYHFVKDKPGASKRRMGDLKFDPTTGVDLAAFEKAALAKHTQKLKKLALRRQREALIGRGT